MRKCPDPRCKYRTNNANQFAAHLKAHPHHEPGKTFKEYKGHKSGQKTAKPGKNQGGEATAK